MFRWLSNDIVVPKCMLRLYIHVAGYVQPFLGIIYLGKSSGTYVSVETELCLTMDAAEYKLVLGILLLGAHCTGTGFHLQCPGQASMGARSLSTKN